MQRMEKFGNGRNHVFYDEKLQLAHHIHFPADGDHRVLQHHYAFAFFANPDMQSFYRRFVRDYMRYRDEIQCAGAELVAAVRADSLKTDPSQGTPLPTPSPSSSLPSFHSFPHPTSLPTPLLPSLSPSHGTPLLPPLSCLTLSILSLTLP